MKNEVVAMCNSRVTVRDEYETAERAHDRYKELVNAWKGRSHDGHNTIVRLQDGYPMAMEQFVWERSPKGLCFLFYYFSTLAD